MFESPEVTFEVANAFRAWHEANVGTELELDEADAGLYVCVAFEMTGKETRACKAWWQERGYAV